MIGNERRLFYSSYDFKNSDDIVKINSKYKEDDFSDSNTVAFSLDACVLKIHFLLMSCPHVESPLIPAPGIESC